MTTLSDQDGVQKIYFGAEVEAPTNLRWFVDWNSRDHHSKFESTPYVTFPPFTLFRLGRWLRGGIHHPSKTLALLTSVC